MTTAQEILDTRALEIAAQAHAAAQAVREQLAQHDKTCSEHRAYVHEGQMRIEKAIETGFAHTGSRIDLVDKKLGAFKDGQTTRWFQISVILLAGTLGIIGWFLTHYAL